jgi:hypothetical protein
MLGEVYIMYRLLREVLRRIAGVPAGSSLLTTVFALGVLANALRHLGAPLLRAFRPGSPSLAAIIFVVAVPAAVLRRITGLRATDAMLVGTTVGVGLTVPAFRAAAAAARASSAAVAALGRLAIGKPPNG